MRDGTELKKKRRGIQSGVRDDIVVTEDDEDGSWSKRQEGKIKADDTGS
jgi:hypothetical protein